MLEQSRSNGQSNFSKLVTKIAGEVGSFSSDSMSVLVVAPTQTPPDDSACTELLTQEPPTKANVLSVTFEASPEERLSVWQHEASETLPHRAKIVDGGGATQTTQTVSTDAGPGVPIETLPTDAGLLDTALTIARTLGQWVDTDEPTLMCLHSLSALLDTYELTAVIQFVSGLNNFCNCLDIRTHHHIDTARHGEDSLEEIGPLYDAVYEHAPAGGWEVTTNDSETATPTSRLSRALTGKHLSQFDGPDPVPIPYSFEAVLEILSASRRRTLLYELKDRTGETFDLERLVEWVYTREMAIPVRESPESRDRVLTLLVQVHLPKLEAAGILTHDSDQHLIEYDTNPALESFVRYIEALELG